MTVEVAMTVEVVMTAEAVMTAEETIEEIIVEIIQIMTGYVADVITRTSRLEQNVIAVANQREKAVALPKNGKAMTEDQEIEEILLSPELAIGIAPNVVNPISQNVTTASVVVAQKEWVALVPKDITGN